MTEDRAQHWEHLARSPVAWLISADNMRSCAELIGRCFVADLMSPPAGKMTKDVEPISFGPIFQMLAGYTVEALLKGINVARQPGFVVGRGRLPNWFTTHNLEGLLSRAGVQLDDADQAFVRRLAVNVVWSGRYPVSTSAEDMERYKFSSSGDLARFRRLYEELVRMLQREMRPEGRPATPTVS